MVTQIGSHAYRGNIAEIHFREQDQKLYASIETPRLLMRSVSEEDLGNYTEMMGDPVVMEKFNIGQPRSPALVKEKIQQWVERWRALDPYSGMAILDRTTNEFIGHVSLEHSDKPGEAAIHTIFVKNHWGQGYGHEMYLGMMEYTLATVEEGYLIEGQPLKAVVATNRVDNVGSIKLAQDAGMKFVKVAEKFGAPRNFFVMTLDEVREKMNQMKRA